ncbi:MAG: hypothetical protein QM755_09770 [Luteolibacter sp.]
MKPKSMETGITQATRRAAREITQKEKQNNNDQDAGFEQVPLHRVDGAVDHLALIVEGDYFHAIGQVELGQFLLRALDHLQAVGSFQGNDHPGNSLAVAIAQDGALSGHCARDDIGYVAK